MNSQYGEEQHVLEITSGLDPATSRVLDVGAWDPVAMSNSRKLIESGWGGILVEPSPVPLKNLMLAYADNERVVVVGGAVTVTGGLLALRMTDDALSAPAVDAEHFKKWGASGGYYGRMIVNAIALKDLFAQLGGDFEMVSFDTEGGSLDLFREMCNLGPRPRCVVVEHDERYVELAQIAEAANYQQVHLNGTNVVLRWTGKRE